MTEFQDMTVVTLRCATEGCKRWATAHGRHLDNLLASGPWRCPDHADEPTEVPC